MQRFAKSQHYGEDVEHEPQIIINPVQLMHFN